MKPTVQCCRHQSMSRWQRSKAERFQEPSLVQSLVVFCHVDGDGISIQISDVFFLICRILLLKKTKKKQNWCLTGSPRHVFSVGVVLWTRAAQVGTFWVKHGQGPVRLWPSWSQCWRSFSGGGNKRSRGWCNGCKAGKGEFRIYNFDHEKDHSFADMRSA